MEIEIALFSIIFAIFGWLCYALVKIRRLEEEVIKIKYDVETSRLTMKSARKEW